MLGLQRRVQRIRLALTRVSSHTSQTVQLTLAQGTLPPIVIVVVHVDARDDEPSTNQRAHTLPHWALKVMPVTLTLDVGTHALPAV